MYVEPISIYPFLNGFEVLEGGVKSVFGIRVLASQAQIYRLETLK